MASADEEAVVRCAAMRAELILGQVAGSIALLLEKMGDLTFEPDRDELSRWCTIIFWLRTVIDDEADNLRDSLDHDQLVAQAQQS